MLAENQRFDDPHDVLFVFWIRITQLRKNAGLNETLFVQAFFVAKDLEGHDLLILMVEAFEHLAERALPYALLDLVAIGNVIASLANVLAFVVIKAAVFRPIWCRQRLTVVTTLQYVQIVDLIIFEYLSLLIIQQILAQVHDDVARLHWELYLKLSIDQWVGPLLRIGRKTLPRIVGLHCTNFKELVVLW